LLLFLFFWCWGWNPGPLGKHSYHRATSQPVKKTILKYV
jgi:hypothetical protein